MLAARHFDAVAPRCEVHGVEARRPWVEGLLLDRVGYLSRAFSREGAQLLKGIGMTEGMADRSTGAATPPGCRERVRWGGSPPDALDVGIARRPRVSADAACRRPVGRDVDQRPDRSGAWARERTHVGETGMAERAGSAANALRPPSDFAVRVTAGADDVVCVVSGALDCVTAPTLRTALDAAAELVHEVSVDLSAVTFIDAAALHVLDDADRRLRAEARRLHVRGVAPMVRRLVSLARSHGHV